MRRMVIIFLMFTLFLAACQPAQAPLSGAGPEGEETPPHESQKSPDDVYPPPETPSTGQSLSPGGGVTGSGNSFGDDPPVLEWDTDPENVVVSGTFCCGFVPYLAVVNYIPEVQIFGDGRYIWVEQSESGARTVWQGQLSQEEIGKLLQSMEDEGFFGWDDRYVDQSVTDLADKCLQVNLRSASKSVCEYHRGAPQAFHDLFDRLASGAGASGEAFVPERGYLTANPLGSDFKPAGGESVAGWDASQFAISLADAGEGAWLEGEALDAAWAAVNAKPFFPLVQQNGSYYELSLQIPGLSREAPPGQ